MKRTIKYIIRKPIFNIFEILISFGMGIAIGAECLNTSTEYVETQPNNQITNLSMVVSEEIKPTENYLEPTVFTEEVEPIASEPEYSLTQEEIELIALVTMAEAEGEPEEGQRLVIDTILNRVDGEHWPNSVKEVIYQKNQFTSMWNGRTDRCYVKPELVELVKQELISRTDNDVVFFRTTRYSDYGVPKCQVCCHYFSSYN